MRKLLVAVAATVLFFSCSQSPHTESEIALGTVCSITSYDKDDEPYVSEAFGILRDVEHLIDFHDEGSELWYVNLHAHESPVKVSDELFALLCKAYEVSERSGGAFDIAIGPLVGLWGIGTDGARVPDDEEIDSVLDLVDYHDIVLDPSESTVFFAKEGMMIDLGGIGKGYAADLVASFLRSCGVERCIVNLGGNVYVIGEKEPGKPWTVALQDPDTERGGYYATVDCSDSAVVTSGAYERYFEAEDGTRYHHILSSETGRPAESDLVSASVIGPDSTLADALSTACFVLGSEKGAELVRSYGLSAVFLTADGMIVRIDP